VFGNRLLSRISGHKTKKVMEAWRKLHEEELHNFYYLLYFITAMRTRRMAGVGHVACKTNDKFL
jgi:hypothetical protein